MLKRLLELKKAVIEIYQELEWDGLMPSEWGKLETVLELLEPFAKYTQLAPSTTVPTFSSIVPIFQVHVFTWQWYSRTLS